MCQGNEKLLMGKFLKENICQKNELDEKNIAKSQKAALSTYRVTCLSCPPPLKILSVQLGKNYKVPESAPLICMRIWSSAIFYKFFCRHKLRVLSDSETWTFAPNLEFLSNTLKIYSKVWSTKVTKL